MSSAWSWAGRSDRSRLQLGYAEPDVPFLTIGLLVFAAAIIGVTAYATRRTVQRNRFDLAPHQAVNRLALGKACAIAGAFLVGAYLGYALAQLGVGDPSSSTRLWRSCLAALAAGAVMGAALLLEPRVACRGPPNRDLRSIHGSYPPGSRNRRRQRSVRVTVAVGLLSLATVAVLGSLPTQSPLWLSLASTSAIVLSWAALRIMWTEVLQSRRENSADRAAAATAYRELFSVRAAEHAEFTEAMTERLAEAHLAQRELEGLVAYQEGRARRAETKLVTESKALVETRSRAKSLEESLSVLQAGGGDAVVDLVAWEEQTEQKTAAQAEAEAAQASLTVRGARRPSVAVGVHAGPQHPVHAVRSEYAEELRLLGDSDHRLVLAHQQGHRVLQRR